MIVYGGTFLAILAAAGLAGLFLAVAWAARGSDDTLVVAALRLVLDGYMRLYHRLRWTPREAPIPLRGPAIVVANHRSGVDPLALAACTRRKIHFLMAREYYEQRGLRWLFHLARAIPVNRDGKDLGATKAALKVLRNGGVIGIFPEGGIRVEGGPEVDGKAGVGLLALKSGAPVIPAHISGTPSYDSVFAAIITPSHSLVSFGEPMLSAPIEGRKPGREEMEAVARRVLERVRELGALDGMGADAAPARTIP
jgi:1-acyl-sn-glycerol-3-phosphate acyltransferase